MLAKECKSWECTVAAFVHFLRTLPPAASLTELMPGVGGAVLSGGLHSPRSQREHSSVP